MTDCGCYAILRALALEELAAADKAARHKKPGVNEALIRRRATSLAWAAGALRQHQQTARPPPTQRRPQTTPQPTLFEE